VISRLYEHHVSVRDAIKGLVQGTGIEEEIMARLEQPGDSRSFSHHLLTRTVICLPPSKACVGPLARMSQRSSQDQVSASVPAPAIRAPPSK
jgi:hypothetical protein